MVEILDGNFETGESEFTYANFLGDLSPDEAINGQMIIDYPVNPEFRAPSYFVINEAVMNRLLSGKSKGIAGVIIGQQFCMFNLCGENFHGKQI